MVRFFYPSSFHSLVGSQRLFPKEIGFRSGLSYIYSLVSISSTSHDTRVWFHVLDCKITYNDHLYSFHRYRQFAKSNFRFFVNLLRLIYSLLLGYKRNSKVVLIQNAKQRYTGIFCEFTVRRTKNQLLRVY